MPDYDVSALALSVPPADASLTTYRPSISVKNNGLYPATATGTISAYIDGRQIFTSNVQSEAIAPGETGLAVAADVWTPTAQGDVMWFGYVTITRDQNQSNGYLAPVTIHVGPTPPEPPGPVANHVSQHEPGGSDVLIVTNLHGKLADAQTPLAHKASHQVGGSDLLDVTGLPGILAQEQPIADHHEAHENHGGDELNVEGLSGELYNLQKPKVHANEAHDPNYITQADLDSHANASSAHSAALNIAQSLGWFYDFTGYDDGLEHEVLHFDLPPSFWTPGATILLFSNIRLDQTASPATLILRAYHQKIDDIGQPTILIGEASLAAPFGVPAGAQASLQAWISLRAGGATASAAVNGLASMLVAPPGPNPTTPFFCSNSINATGQGRIIVTAQYFTAIAGINWWLRTGSLTQLAGT